MLASRRRRGLPWLSSYGPGMQAGCDTGAKTPSNFSICLSARLKSCPFKTARDRRTQIYVCSNPKLVRGFPVEDDFAGVAGAHGLEALLEFVPLEAVGDDFGDVEAGLEHDRHL